MKIFIIFQSFLKNVINDNISFQNYCTLLIDRSSSKKEQPKLHRSLLGVKGGGGKNSPLNSPLSNIIAVTVKINIFRPNFR